ncbi:MAG: cytochrome c-type biogenesis protein CcmH/NrfG [Paraglaciecola sp.]|jgi:cytochrome c-type biogenesis protein CcmH/NrfG
MNIRHLLGSLTLCFTLLFSSLAMSDEPFDGQLLALQHQWAKVNYTLTDDAQSEGFEQLLIQAQTLVEQNKERAEPLVWLGIIQSSYAGAKGAFGALSLAKKARKSLERSLTMDDLVLSGSAYTSLGTLFHKVPGWPIGFGDDDDAKMMLEKAITLNPKGIDSHYFYGEFLFDKRDYAKAKEHLLLALNAPTRDNRPLADQYRRAEIQQLMAKVDKKLQKKH